MPTPSSLFMALVSFAEQQMKEAAQELDHGSKGNVPALLESAGRACLQAAAELRARAAYEKGART